MSEDSNLLYARLKEVYVEKNLNHISRSLIQAYRNGYYDYINNLARQLDIYLDLGSATQGKAFAGLIMLYHPDKLGHYQKQIEAAQSGNIAVKPDQLTHIFITLNYLSQVPTPKPTDNSISPVHFGRGIDPDEFDNIRDSLNGRFSSAVQEQDFLSALELREFGTMGHTVQTYHLQSLSGHLDLSHSGLTDLSGLEYCTQLNSLDLSENDLLEITAVGFLTHLEELYLFQNRIDDIEVLSGLTELRLLDLAFNQIENVEALIDLPHLKYLNLIGNPVPEKQIERLRKTGLILTVGL